ncbi:MAG: PatB family C-S lyase [Candidatus Aminicenantes bacterium]|nr:PatB family C-S lyase [Candidatus Aminicenantes bacterium]
MNFDFDTILDRRGTGSLKWDYPARRLNAPEALPMWVADMDFAAPPAVTDALARRLAHGAFGYASFPESVREAVAVWMAGRFGWNIRPEWISIAPGVVPSLYAGIRALTRPGDGVIIQTPVYPPFFSAVEATGRRLVKNPLRFENGRWTMDFGGLERLIDERTRTIVFCSPHNPVGRVWSEEELGRLAEICLERDLSVISDEIHGDLVFRGRRHIPFASLGPEVAQRTITLAAPSKTFNIAGLAASLGIAQNRAHREAFRREFALTGWELPNIFGLTAMEAAYRSGGPWLDALLEYLEAGADQMDRFFADRLTPLRFFKPEGTYLALIDGRGLGLDPAAWNDFLLRKAGVYLNDGAAFGEELTGFSRLNFACPHAVLDEALSRLERALGGIR